MRSLLVLASLLALASSAVAAPIDHPVSRSRTDRGDAQLTRASLECLDDGLGMSFGTCPSPLKACQIECDIGYDEDTLRCMSGAGGILIDQ